MRRVAGLPLAVLTAVLAAVLAAVALTGCGAAADSGQSGGSSPSPSASATSVASQHNDADVAFAQGMIPHHAQAVEMAKLAVRGQASAPVRALAQRIEAAQAPEIAVMAGWLRSWGKPVPSTSGAGHDAGAHAHDHGGMLTEPEMTRLAAARGRAWDRLFLTSMARHHDGAIAMARTELAQGTNTAAKALAQRVIDTQSAENALIKRLLGGGGSTAAARLPAEMGHIHGMGVNPADGKLYLGTHTGAWVLDAGTVRRVGSTQTDLMGFAVAGPDHFYASGHPGQGEDLPNPVGLIESRDAGRTWASLSRGGQSDFHALAAAGDAVYGFDGRLRATVDGRTWADRNADLRPASLAVDPSRSSTVLATTESGVQRSDDSGATFRAAGTGPLLLHLAWPTSATLWGVAPDGAVHRSSDGGATWQRRGSVEAQPHALAASATEVTIATADGIVTSQDAGRTFAKVAAAG